MGPEIKIEAIALINAGTAYQIDVRYGDGKGDRLFIDVSEWNRMISEAHKKHERVVLGKDWLKDIRSGYIPCHEDGTDFTEKEITEEIRRVEAELEELEA